MTMMMKKKEKKRHPSTSLNRLNRLILIEMYAMNDLFNKTVLFLSDSFVVFQISVYC